MKEIIPKIFKLETENERNEFFDGLWSTDLFKALVKSKHPVISMIRENYIKYPRYYYNMQNRDQERAAFTSWYNVLSLKNYENKYIQDLYYFHELMHISTMTYESHLDFTSWSLKMRNNEILASMNSEVFIYFYSPEYRKHTFKEEIWADRFLNNPYYLNLGKTNLTQLAIELTAKRTEAYDKPKDPVEDILSYFRKFSHLYYDVWKDHYKELESVLNAFYKGSVAEYEEYLRKNQSPNHILFEERVEEHHQNYLKHNNSRPHY